MHLARAVELPTHACRGVAADLQPGVAHSGCANIMMSWLRASDDA